ncbi:hypothetical protein Cadr_000023033 [Camelus dromedarius]|uniref:Uncharacterized protein n=1 Tax=Camelus dromedarius TaxID=9838 RepID=A0A5N4CIK2_CAMDR|nr:hypothetical protein Cadr_000023033 [Camelus dromedarius]
MTETRCWAPGIDATLTVSLVTAFAHQSFRERVCFVPTLSSTQGRRAFSVSVQPGEPHLETASSLLPHLLLGSAEVAQARRSATRQRVNGLCVAGREFPARTRRPQGAGVGLPQSAAPSTSALGKCGGVPVPSAQSSVQALSDPNLESQAGACAGDGKGRPEVDTDSLIAPALWRVEGALSSHVMKGSFLIVAHAPPTHLASHARLQGPWGADSISRPQLSFSRCAGSGARETSGPGGPPRAGAGLAPPLGGGFALGSQARPQARSKTQEVKALPDFGFTQMWPHFQQGQRAETRTTAFGFPDSERTHTPHDVPCKHLTRLCSWDGCSVQMRELSSERGLHPGLSMSPSLCLRTRWVNCAPCKLGWVSLASARSSEPVPAGISPDPSQAQDATALSSPNSVISRCVGPAVFLPSGDCQAKLGCVPAIRGERTCRQLTRKHSPSSRQAVLAVFSGLRQVRAAVRQTGVECRTFRGRVWINRVGSWDPAYGQVQELGWEQWLTLTLLPLNRALHGALLPPSSHCGLAACWLCNLGQVTNLSDSVGVKCASISKVLGRRPGAQQPLHACRVLLVAAGPVYLTEEGRLSQALVFRSHALGHACRDLKGRAQVPGPDDQRGGAWPPEGKARAGRSSENLGSGFYSFGEGVGEGGAGVTSQVIIWLGTGLISKGGRPRGSHFRHVLSRHQVLGSQGILGTPTTPSPEGVRVAPAQEIIPRPGQAWLPCFPFHPGQFLHCSRDWVLLWTKWAKILPRGASVAVLERCSVLPGQLDMICMPAPCLSPSPESKDRALALQQRSPVLGKPPHPPLCSMLICPRRSPSWPGLGHVLRIRYREEVSWVRPPPTTAGQLSRKLWGRQKFQPWEELLAKLPPCLSLSHGEKVPCPEFPHLQCCPEDLASLGFAPTLWQRGPQGLPRGPRRGRACRALISREAPDRATGSSQHTASPAPQAPHPCGERMRPSSRRHWHGSGVGNEVTGTQPTPGCSVCPREAFKGQKEGKTCLPVRVSRVVGEAGGCGVAQALGVVGRSENPLAVPSLKKVIPPPWRAGRAEGLRSEREGSAWDRRRAQPYWKRGVGAAPSPHSQHPSCAGGRAPRSRRLRGGERRRALSHTSGQTRQSALSLPSGRHTKRSGSAFLCRQREARFANAAQVGRGVSSFPELAGQAASGLGLIGFWVGQKQRMHTHTASLHASLPHRIHRPACPPPPLPGPAVAMTTGWLVLASEPGTWASVQRTPLQVCGAVAMATHHRGSAFQWVLCLTRSSARPSLLPALSRGSRRNLRPPRLEDGEVPQGSWDCWECQIHWKLSFDRCCCSPAAVPTGRLRHPASPRPVQTRGQVGVWAPGSSWAGQEERWGLLSTLPPGPSPPSSTTAPESLRWGLHTSWGHTQLLSKPQEQLHGNSMKPMSRFRIHQQPAGVPGNGRCAVAVRPPAPQPNKHQRALPDGSLEGDGSSAQAALTGGRGPGGFNSTSVFLTVLDAGKPQVKVLAISAPSRGSFPGLQTAVFSPRPQVVQRGSKRPASALVTQLPPKRPATMLGMIREGFLEEAAISPNGQPHLCPVGLEGQGRCVQATESSSAPPPSPDARPAHAPWLHSPPSVCWASFPWQLTHVDSQPWIPEEKAAEPGPGKTKVVTRLGGSECVSPEVQAHWCIPTGPLCPLAPLLLPGAMEGGAQVHGGEVCLPPSWAQGRGEDRVPAVTHPKVILLKNQRVPRRGKERVCWPPCGPGLQRGERRGCWDAIPGPGSLSSAPAAPDLPTGTGRSLLFTAPTHERMKTAGHGWEEVTEAAAANCVEGPRAVRKGQGARGFCPPPHWLLKSSVLPDGSSDLTMVQAPIPLDPSLHTHPQPESSPLWQSDPSVLCSEPAGAPSSLSERPGRDLRASTHSPPPPPVLAPSFCSRSRASHLLAVLQTRQAHSASAFAQAAPSAWKSLPQIPTETWKFPEDKSSCLSCSLPSPAPVTAGTCGCVSGCAGCVSSLQPGLVRVLSTREVPAESWKDTGDEVAEKRAGGSGHQWLEGFLQRRRHWNLLGIRCWLLSWADDSSALAQSWGANPDCGHRNQEDLPVFSTLPFALEGAQCGLACPLPLPQIPLLPRSPFKPSFPTSPLSLSPHPPKSYLKPRGRLQTPHRQPGFYLLLVSGDCQRLWREMSQETSGFRGPETGGFHDSKPASFPVPLLLVTAASAPTPRPAGPLPHHTASRELSSLDQPCLFAPQPGSGMLCQGRSLSFQESLEEAFCIYWLYRLMLEWLLPRQLSAPIAQYLEDRHSRGSALNQPRRRARRVLSISQIDRWHFVQREALKGVARTRRKPRSETDGQAARQRAFSDKEGHSIRATPGTSVRGGPPDAGTRDEPWTLSPAAHAGWGGPQRTSCFSVGWQPVNSSFSAEEETELMYRRRNTNNKQGLP